VASKPVKLKRSMMPHRPVAIELADSRVVAPGAGKALDMTKVKHLFGVRKTSKGILFVQPLSMGRRLEIAGDFNGWTPALTMMTTNEALGVYEKHLELPKGKYNYKLVVDGQWCVDPYNASMVENGLGGMNNQIRIE